MTLEEATKHAREVSARCQGNEACSRDHAQLADWLEELQAWRNTATAIINLLDNLLDNEK